MSQDTETPPLAILSDLATDAHTRIQQDFAKIDPIVGVSQNMRNEGIPADLMTIDCLKTNKRIILVLHDQMPGLVMYQFAFRDREPEEQFQQMDFSAMSSNLLYEWIQCYFQDKPIPEPNH